VALPYVPRQSQSGFLGEVENQRDGDSDLPSQVRPFIRAKPREQVGSVVGRTGMERGVTLSSQSWGPTPPSATNGPGRGHRAVPGRPCREWYRSRSARRGSPRQPRGWHSIRTAELLPVGSPHNGHPGSAASRCLWYYLERRGGITCWLVPASQPTDAQACQRLSPTHMVPEGPSRLPGAHSQA
jgi:hypothetical protein